MAGLMDYWYHFAIMFEALFILTVIDAGTRVGRFIVGEFLGRVYAPLAKPNWLPGAMLTTTIVVVSWAAFIWTGNISTIWPMFGIANQLLAAVALAIGTTILINMGRARYAWVTIVPMTFLSVTTLTAGFLSVKNNFLPMATGPNEALHFQGMVNTIADDHDDGARRHHPRRRRAEVDRRREDGGRSGSRRHDRWSGRSLDRPAVRAHELRPFISSSKSLR